MHIITSVETERQTEELGHLLKKSGIRYAFELRRLDNGEQFDLIILKEEDVKRARRLIKAYTPGMHSIILEKDEPILPRLALAKTGVIGRRRRSRPLTLFFVLLCVCTFLVHEVQRRQIVVSEEKVHVDILVITPVMKWFLIDFPKAFELVVEFQEAFPHAPNPSFKGLSTTQNTLLKQMRYTPFWGGLYPVTIAKLTGKSATIQSGETFEKVRVGHLWRFFTPSFLHDSLLHLFFNMFWLLALGSLIERRIGSGRTLVLILTAMVFSNIAQYLVSGPLFLGFSGVACSFAGFIFARRKTAPWENYKVEPAIFWLFFGYVGVLASVQVLIFILEILGIHMWPLRIANTAHVIGAITGYGVGRLSFFSWQVRT